MKHSRLPRPINRVARRVSARRNTIRRAKVHKVLRDGQLLLDNSRRFDHGRRETRVDVPLNVTVEQPHTGGCRRGTESQKLLMGRTTSE